MANKYWTEQNMYDSDGKVCYSEEYGIFRIQGKTVTLSDGDNSYNAKDIYYIDETGRLCPFGSINEKIINVFNYKLTVRVKDVRGSRLRDDPITLKKITITYIYLKDLAIFNRGALNNLQTITIEATKDNAEELTKKVYVCSNYDLWRKTALNVIYVNKKAGDKLYYLSKGICKMVKIYDQPYKYALRLNYNGEEFDVECGDNNVLELPTFEGYDEYAVFSEAKNEQLLQPYVESGVKTPSNIITLSVYWRLIDEAASYTVSIYKKISRAHKAEVMKMRDFIVERNTGYLVVDNLVGTNFIIKVTAEDRNGNIIAMSRGIENSGEPKNW